MDWPLLRGIVWGAAAEVDLPTAGSLTATSQATLYRGASPPSGGWMAGGALGSVTAGRSGGAADLGDGTGIVRVGPHGSPDPTHEIEHRYRVHRPSAEPCCSTQSTARIETTIR